MTDELLTASDVGKRWNGYKETKAQLYAMLEAGWELRQGAGYATAYCPCPDERASIPIWKTPKNDSNHARRLKRLASHCPEHHELLHQKRERKAAEPPKGATEVKGKDVAK